MQVLPDISRCTFAFIVCHHDCQPPGTVEKGQVTHSKMLNTVWANVDRNG
jgi:hypothetical protein